jgi:hypothetical protein
MMVHQVSAAVGNDTLSVSFDGDVESNGDAAIAAFLLPAMLRGEPLTVDAGASTRLLGALHGVQGVLSTWWPEYRRVDVNAPVAPSAPPPAGTGVASFFSGGVDSFFTALRRRDLISHLVIVRGFDIALDRPDLWQRAVTAARRAAEALGKPLLEIETDLRVVLPMSWKHFHGCALATVGHLLGHRVGRVLVPATHTYNELFPWGSHPALDPLWSGDHLEFEHDGADTSRFEKVQAIAHDPAVLQHLRVCWRNPDDAYNCGHCEKCVRTMIALHIAGTLDQCATLPSNLDYTRVARMTLMSTNDIAFADENLDAAKATGDTSLVNAIRTAKAVSRLRLARQVAGPRERVRRVARRLVCATT